MPLGLYRRNIFLGLICVGAVGWRVQLTLNAERIIKTSRSEPFKIKIRSKNLGRQRCAEGFNSGVKGFNKKGKVIPLQAFGAQRVLGG
jgi:hypothetical protein